MKKLIMALMLCLVSICGFGQNPCGNNTTVYDIDSNFYLTVAFGNQCWLKEDLRVTKTINGTPLNHTNNFSTYNSYGYYKGSIIDSVCPNGWKLPSVDDVMSLILYSISRTDLYDIVDFNWQSMLVYGANNLSGLSFRNASGMRSNTQLESCGGYRVENSTYLISAYHVSSISSDNNRFEFYEPTGISLDWLYPIRCIKDTSYTEVEQPTNDTIFIHDTITLVDTLYIYDTIYIHDTIILSDTIYIHDGDVGIHEWGKNIKVYPNPSNETIILENAEGCECILYGINGAVVHKYHLMSSVERISIGDLTSGVYFAKIIKNGKTNVLKIIKE